MMEKKLPRKFNLFYVSMWNLKMKLSFIGFYSGFLLEKISLRI